jgi:integrase/recombinase XerD
VLRRWHWKLCESPANRRRIAERERRAEQIRHRRIIRPFIEKSLSAETRRAYGRVTKEFFKFHKLVDTSEIKPLDVIRRRASLIENKKSAATVSFKLSVIRSLFEYLKADGFVPNSPALTKLVTSPKLSEVLRGKALTVKEVNYILAGPDKEKPEGARDYAILLTLLRTSLRVAEVCNLKTSSIKWSHGRWTLKFNIKGGREDTIPLPIEVKKAIDEYLRLDRDRRKILKTAFDDNGLVSDSKMGRVFGNRQSFAARSQKNGDYQSFGQRIDLPAGANDEWT